MGGRYVDRLYVILWNLEVIDSHSYPLFRELMQIMEKHEQ